MSVLIFLSWDSLVTNDNVLFLSYPRPLAKEKFWALTDIRANNVTCLLISSELTLGVSYGNTTSSQLRISTSKRLHHRFEVASLISRQASLWVVVLLGVRRMDRILFHTDASLRTSRRRTISNFKAVQLDYSTGCPTTVVVDNRGAGQETEDVTARYGIIFIQPCNLLLHRFLVYVCVWWMCSGAPSTIINAATIQESVVTLRRGCSAVLCHFLTPNYSLAFFFSFLSFSFLKIKSLHFCCSIMNSMPPNYRCTQPMQDHEKKALKSRGTRDGLFTFHVSSRSSAWATRGQDPISYISYILSLLNYLIDKI